MTPCGRRRRPSGCSADCWTDLDSEGACCEERAKFQTQTETPSMGRASGSEGSVCMHRQVVV